MIYLTELKKQIQRKQLWMIFLFFLCVVFFDFYLTCKYYQGKPLSQIPSASDVIIIWNSYDGSIGDLFFRSFIFILIICLIGSDTFYLEKEAGLQNFIFTRICREHYILAQAAAVMTVVFGITFLTIVVSQILVCMAFPIQGYTVRDLIAYNSLLKTPGYMLSGLRAVSPYLNNIVYACLWGMVAAVFALFSYALGFLYHAKRYVLLLVPAIIFLVYDILISELLSKFSGNFVLEALDINLLTRNGVGSGFVYGGILFVLTGISCLFIWKGLRDDQKLL